mgnify:CR=1 FL=1
MNNIYDRLKISITVLLQFLLFVIYIEVFTVNDFLIYFVLMFLIYISILFGGSLYGFVALTASILAIAFGQVYTAWISGSGFQLQAELISKQMLSIAFLILFWVMLSHVVNLTVQNREMKEKLKVLERTDEITGVLTKGEFIERFKIVFTAMQRRNQSGYFVVLRWAGLDIKSRERTYYSKSIARIIGQSCLNSIRKQYDLAGAVGNNTLLIVLQNASLEGTQIVIDRIKDNIKKEKNINATILLKNVNVQAYPIPTSLDEAINFIDTLSQGSREE